jgi:hypothetical protein
VAYSSFATGGYACRHITDGIALRALVPHAAGGDISRFGIGSVWKSVAKAMALRSDEVVRVARLRMILPSRSFTHE